MYLKLEPVVVTHELDLGIKNLYKNPTSVGADRLCNSVGGYFKYGGPLIIVDFGTATSFDVVSQAGEYLGGIIAPGIEMASQMLHRKAAKLPRVELAFPDSVIGQTTESSIQSGIMFGSVDLVNGFVARINKELGQVATSVATGGLAKLLLQELEEEFTIDPHLTLDGLKIIFERTKS